MKAKDLVKKEFTIEQILENIKQDNEHGCFKHFIPHWMIVSDKTKLKLIEDGFKVYNGHWDGYKGDGLIIEW